MPYQPLAFTMFLFLNYLIRKEKLFIKHNQPENSYQCIRQCVVVFTRINAREWSGSYQNQNKVISPIKSCQETRFLDRKYCYCALASAYAVIQVIRIGTSSEYWRPSQSVSVKFQLTVNAYQESWAKQRISNVVDSIHVISISITTTGSGRPMIFCQMVQFPKPVCGVLCTADDVMESFLDFLDALTQLGIKLITRKKWTLNEDECDLFMILYVAVLVEQGFDGTMCEAWR